MAEAPADINVPSESTPAAQNTSSVRATTIGESGQVPRMLPATSAQGSSAELPSQAEPPAIHLGDDGEASGASEAGGGGGGRRNLTTGRLAAILAGAVERQCLELVESWGHRVGKPGCQFFGGPARPQRLLGI